MPMTCERGRLSFICSVEISRNFNSDVNNYSRSLRVLDLLVGMWEIFFFVSVLKAIKLRK